MNFDQHLAALAACRLCPNVLGSPVTGAVAGAKVMLVGQAPGPREMEQLCGVRRPRRRSTAPAGPAHSTLKDVVGRVHRVERAGKRFDVIVLPHPSGRSTWTNKPDNAALLSRSLELIGAHAAWRKTFSSRRPRG